MNFYVYKDNRGRKKFYGVPYENAKFYNSGWFYKNLDKQSQKKYVYFGGFFTIQREDEQNNIIWSEILLKGGKVIFIPMTTWAELYWFFVDPNNILTS